MMQNLRPAMVDKADEIVGALEDAISCLEGAVEALKSTKDGTLDVYAEDLNDVIRYLKDEKEPYDNILAEDYRQEIEGLTRDYWRMVL